MMGGGVVRLYFSASFALALMREGKSCRLSWEITPTDTQGRRGEGKKGEEEKGGEEEKKIPRPWERISASPFPCNTDRLAW
jgi:hypothetical protein